MAENVKALRRRLRSVKNTKQITRAMEMVSAAKLRRAEELLRAGRPYAAKLQEFLGHLAASATTDHPYFELREVAHRTLVLVTADRGLAGAFNNALIKRAEAVLRQPGAPPTSLVCLGRKGYDYFRNREWPIAFQVTDFAGRCSGARAAEIADRLAGAFIARETDEILVLANTFVSMLVYRPIAFKLLPLDPAELLGGAEDDAHGHGVHHPPTDYILEPSPAAVFASILPRYVRSRLYMTLLDSFTAEHSARRTAMNSATKNCGELIDSLSLRMNKARQAAITKEILEVVAGADALKG
ncbi:MAG: ATP synthase F1 subunit gamma [Candidatus Sumerlaeaceae bacterium]|nr:ATP synthase F1 subunit gamma [Candidatus Sumerlaeaceae bacterium]